MRWNTHIYEVLNNKHCNEGLLKEFNKYGISNFTFRILCLIKKEEVKEIRKIEQEYIKRNEGEGLLNKRRAVKRGNNSNEV